MQFTARFQQKKKTGHKNRICTKNIHQNTFNQSLLNPQLANNVIWTFWTLDGRCFDVLYKLGHNLPHHHISSITKSFSIRKFNLSVSLQFKIHFVISFKMLKIDFQLIDYPQSAYLKRIYHILIQEVISPFYKRNPKKDILRISFKLIT